MSATLPDTATIAPRDAGILDRPSRERRDVVSSDVIADELTHQEPAPVSEPTASASVTVDARPEQVYALVSDLPRMGEWSPENTGGRWLGSRRGTGATFVGANKGPRRWWPTTTLVTDATPGRRFAFATYVGPTRGAEWVYAIEPADDGCRVTESWTDHRPGWLVGVGKVVTGVDDRAAHTRTMIETTLQRLKATAERGAR